MVAVNAFSLTSLPDLLAANLDATKLRDAVQQGADLINRLMTVDWTSTTENAPVRHASWTSTTDCGDPNNDGAFGELADASARCVCAFAKLANADIQLQAYATSTHAPTMW